MRWTAEFKNKMIYAPINKIIPFSNVDGPSNRTAIFFQGCPFNYVYSLRDLRAKLSGRSIDMG